MNLWIDLNPKTLIKVLKRSNVFKFNTPGAFVKQIYFTQSKLFLNTAIGDHSTIW